MIPAFSTLLQRGLDLTVARVCGVSTATTVQENDSEFTAVVAFAGPITGRLYLRADDASTSVLAQKMLQRAEVDDVLRRDATGELASIVCGVICAEFAPLHAFTQTPPRALSAGDEPVRGPAVAVARTRIGRGSVVALLYINKPPTTVSA